MGKICFFNSVSTWGGGEKWHYEMSEFLHKSGEDVVVYSFKKSPLSDRVSNKGMLLREVKVQNLSFLNPIKYISIYLKLKKDKIDLIVLNLPKDIKVGAVAAKLAGIKKIVYRRGSAIPIKNSFLNRFYFKHIITDILANSIATKKTINEKANLFPLPKIKVIYNGVHLKDYKKKMDCIDSEPFVIGNLGRVAYQKNQIALIQLAELLKTKTLNFKVLIGGDGSLLAGLKEEVKKRKLSDVVTFVGNVEDVNEFMSLIDVFVLTSHWEGFGYVIAEASLHQKPVLAYNVSSNPEIIKDGVTGYLVEKDDLEALSQKLLFLNANKTMIKELGVHGENFVRQNFDADKNQLAVLEYFNNLINASKI